MSEGNKVVPDAMLSKEFLSQFKTEADVSKFLKQFHSQVLEKILECEMDVYLGYEKNSVSLITLFEIFATLRTEYPFFNN